MRGLTPAQRREISSRLADLLIRQRDLDERLERAGTAINRCARRTSAESHIRR